MRPFLSCLTVLFLLGLACARDAPFSPTWEGTGGAPVDFSLFSLTPEVPISLCDDNTQQLFIVDSGSPVTLADVGHFDEEVGVRHIGVRGLSPTFTSMEVVFMDWLPDTATISGLLGAGLLSGFDWELNYPERYLVIHTEAMTGPAEDELTVPFSLAGGGHYRPTQGIDITVGATRHLISMDVEGTTALGLLDTGASYVTISDALLNTIGTTERPDLGTIEMTTATGTLTVPMTMLWGMTFEGAELSYGLGMLKTAVVPDDRFEELRAEVGAPVSLLIGGSFLREFHIRVDTDRRSIYVSRPATKAGSVPVTWPGHLRLPVPLVP